MSEVDKQLAREEDRRRNRERFPEMTKVIDEFRSVFGDVKVLWVQEGDQEAGTRSTENWVQLTPGGGNEYVVSRSSRKKTR